MSKQTAKADPQPISPTEGLGGENAHGEEAVPEQATAAQQPGGGGAPGTGANPFPCRARTRPLRLRRRRRPAKPPPARPAERSFARFEAPKIAFTTE